MNTAQMKILAWSAAGVFGVALSGYVALNLPAVHALQPVPQERMGQVLADVGPSAVEGDDIVPYEAVDKALIAANWTGKPPEQPTAKLDEPAQPEPTEMPVAELVKVLWISFDVEEPAQSRTLLSYTAKAGVAPSAVSAGGGRGRAGAGAATGSASSIAQKLQGERLDGPLAHIRVSEIRPGAVVFAFDDEERPTEEVAPHELSLSGVVQLGHESEIRRPRSLLDVPRVANVGAAPPRTVEIQENVFQLGVEDMQEFDRDYSEILANDVRYERHRDPRTGKYDGIEIKEVKPGSLASSHGVKQGDVIKSINGHPVSSTNEAISYVKNHQGQFEVWEIEVVNKGQTKFIKYIPPKK